LKQAQFNGGVVGHIVTKEITVVNQLGLHARPAAMVVKATTLFKSEIFLVRDGTRVNAKSIMGVMMLAAEFGSTLEVEAEGEDAEAAALAVAAVFAGKFGED
jgi:phosphocarrier protein HPr